MRQSDCIEQRLDILTYCLAPGTESLAQPATGLQFGSQHHVVDNRKMGEHGVTLKNDTAILAGLFGQRLSIQQDLTTARGLFTQQHAQECGFTASRCAHQRAELASGHLEGAVNIDVQSADFEAQITQLDPDGSYYVYCRSGNRSGQAIDRMAALGFTDLTNGGSVESASAATGIPVVAAP